LQSQDWIEGTSYWDIEEAFYVNKRGIDPETAHVFTILRWMSHGDFRPLAAAIAEGHPLDQAVLNLLARFIGERRLKLIPRKGRGRPKAPATSARNIVAALAYEQRKQLGDLSDEAFTEIAEALGISEPSVRQAVTAWRRSQSKYDK
jgi:hypothetical protein